MARIRTLKPEIWQSADFLSLNLSGRLAFIWLISKADDEGRLEVSAAHLASVHWPERSSPRWAEAQLVRMEEQGMIVRSPASTDSPYEARVVQLCHWADHQRIQRPTPSRLPAVEAPTTSRPHHHHRPTTRRPLRHHDATTTPPLSRLTESEAPSVLEMAPTTSRPPHGSDRKGGDRNTLSTPNGSESVSLAVVAEGELLEAMDAPLELRDPEQHVFNRWAARARPSGRAKLTPERRALIRRALNDYPLDEVLDAVVGWCCLPSHNGAKDGSVYNELELLLRDAPHIEKFRDATRRGLVVPRSTQEIRQAAYRMELEQEARA